MTKREDCINWEVNSQMCPCKNKECKNWAICCECIKHHWGNEKSPKTACMSGAERPAATLSLAGKSKGCKNFEVNTKMCPCDYEPCTRHAVCCECIRNHWGNATYPATACMRGAVRPASTAGLR